MIVGLDNGATRRPGNAKPVRLAPVEISRRRLLRDSIGAGAALTLGAAAGGLRIPQAAHAASANDGHALGFRSLTDEISLPDIPVDGRLPRWLDGVLLRNGPGLFEIGEQKLNHWFDGLAMLHAFAFAGGRVSYANRFLQIERLRGLPPRRAS